MPQNIGIIGTGRLGRNLAVALHEAGYNLKHAASADGASAEIIAELTGASVIAPPYSRLQEAEIIFITVPDRVIPEIALQLAKEIDDFSGKSVIHCSGILSSEILSPVRDKGAKILSFHPLQTFPPQIDVSRFKDIYFALEGEDITLGKKLAEDLSGKSFAIKPDQKILYHAAACTASNYLFGLAFAAGKMMEAAGIDLDEGIEILLPLISGAVKSLRENGIEKGLTGPIARGDANTVAMHLDALRDHQELEEVYASLGLFLLNLTGIADDHKLEIRNLLSKPLE